MSTYHLQPITDYGYPIVFDPMIRYVGAGTPIPDSSWLVNDLWVDISTTPMVLKRWNGTVFVT